MPTFWNRMRQLVSPTTSSSRSADETIESFTQSMNDMTTRYIAKTAELKQCSKESVREEVDSEVKRRIEAAWQQGF